MRAESKAEELLAEAAATGLGADMSQWSEEDGRTIRGDFLAAVMLGEGEDSAGKGFVVHKRGLRLKGAVIDGLVNLGGIRDPAGDALLPALYLLDCDMPDGLNFSHSRIARVDIKGGKAGNVEGQQAHVAGAFAMQEGEFSTLNLNNTTIEKTIFLSTESGPQTRFSGPVTFHSTTVGSSFLGTGGRFDKGITLTSAKVTGDVILRTYEAGAPFVAGGAVILQGAAIGGAFECGGGRFDKGINAQAAEIGEAVLLRANCGRPFVSQGPVDFLGATIKTGFDCRGGWFFDALKIAQARIEGNVTFGVLEQKPSIVDFVFSASNVTIIGDLIMTGGIHPGGLNIQGAVVKGRFDSKGFWGAKDKDTPDIKELLRQLAAVPLADIKLFADGLKGEAAKKARLKAVGPYGAVFRDLKRLGTDALPKGLFDLTDARVGTLADHPLYGWPGPEGCLKLNGFRYDRIELADGKASRHRWWWWKWFAEAPSRFSRRVRGGTNENGQAAPMWQRRLMWLRHQQKATMRWPQCLCRCWLKWLRYCKCRRWLRWLRYHVPLLRPRPEGFHPQPYEQLAKTLRAMGHGADADKIAVEKRRYRIACRVDSWWTLTGRLFLLGVSKHGYSSGRAFLVLAAFIAIGWCLAYQGAGADCFIVATGAPVGADLSHFNSLFYAIDVATPFIEFGPEGSFVVAPTAPWWFVAGHMVYRLLGWVLVSITIFTLTGLMRRD